ncbi:Predicted mannose-6-phosphate isomerase [Serratia proteamaculans]|nr:Predicted mannose-6-phosphate isomerase [Serratia proteamaculans]CAI1619258.1 Predicted mannose-6-phosphate isomerase [Serratia proteamaculans]CAI1704754.1 Predicted mannose-6-phosphate isomerase [Serratia proteamaculans]CAI1716567.1 Predicted mannose-6-phosphate isomerase [Serratia proteamaculans]CAI2436751.1 Predicted mannose-6-phosphate isomerase [Serratia proteamaculans]
MKLLAASTIILSMLAPVALAETEKQVKIQRSGSQPSRPGPEDYFTGKVRIDAPFAGSEPARVGGATVTFEPGARTAWHTHPLGQTLIVTQGRGWIQVWGDEIQEMNQGDIVWIPEDVKHWHGATPDTAMTHIAIAESLNGSPVDWMEQVSDAQYQK